MKFIIPAVAVFAFFSMAYAAETPEQVVKTFFDAYENAEGNALINCMSNQALRDVNDYIHQLNETPEESSSFLATLGIQITAEELTDITAGDFVTALFTSSAYSDNLPDFSDAEFGEASIHGDRALVPVTIHGNVEKIELMLENQSWKIVGYGMEML